MSGILVTVVGSLGRRVRWLACWPPRACPSGSRPRAISILECQTTSERWLVEERPSSVRSNAPVETIRGGPGGRMAWRHAVARRAIASHVAAGRAVRRHRDGDRHRRRAGLTTRCSDCGGGDVSRHRDSGGNIRHPRRLLLGAFVLPGAWGAARCSPPSRCSGYAVWWVAARRQSRTLMAVVFGSRGATCAQRAAAAGGRRGAVVTDPLSVVDPAFVLTFGATLGILVAVPTMRVRPQRSTQSPQKSHGLPFSAGSAGSALHVAFVGMLAASIAAEALLFPVGALVFSRVTVAGLVLNFLAIPLMAVAQVAGIALVPLALISERLAVLAGWLAHLGAGGLVWSADLVRFVPAVTWRVAPPAWSVVVVYYMALTASWALWRRRSEVTGSAEAWLAARVRWFTLMIAFVTAVWILAQPLTLLGEQGDGRLHVTFLDVGQGDSALIRFPRGRRARGCGRLTGSSASTSATAWWRPFCARGHSTSRLYRA